MVSWSRRQLSSLLDQSMDGILAVDGTGEVSVVNSAVKDLLGYDPDELIGMNAFGFIHEEDRDAVIDRFTMLLDNPGTTTDRVQHRLVHQDGRTI